MIPEFFVDHSIIQQRIAEIEPAVYARTRNYLDGAVTGLSPFITHGIIDTRTIADSVWEADSAKAAEKLLTELAWREFFHRVWQMQGDEIFSDMRNPQENVDSDRIPTAIVDADSGLTTLDECIAGLVAQGYMHNHARLWVAAVVCNVARTHWYQPARWLYYHLLDGDLASNSLSWQWVSGSFSHRKYYANQENLNRFARREQHDTFLDCSYEQLPGLSVPEVMRKRSDFVLDNQFPVSACRPVSNTDRKVLLHSIWNLDPLWHNDESAQGIFRRILWIEPKMHVEFALSSLRWKFVEHWARQIEGLEIFVGEREALFPDGVDGLHIITREYPATSHWPGIREPRRWCYGEPNKPVRSFSGYWKIVRNESEYFRGA